jgi:hypothetical protein
VQHLLGQGLARPVPRERREGKRARTRARTVRPGTCVRFARPLRFGDGEERDTFIFKTRSTFGAPGTDCLYRIPRWRTDYDYEVVNPTQTILNASNEEAPKTNDDGAVFDPMSTA